MTRFATKVRTYWSLGWANILRVAAYRARIKKGLFRTAPTQTLPLPALFFRRSELPPVAAVTPTAWQDTGALFDTHSFPVSYEPPNWLANPISGKLFPNADLLWWKIPDFNHGFGDIKLIWELSRFGWVLAMAQRARGGDETSLDRLNRWLADWCLKNPPYYGPNWKCGQEASIRVMHLAMASLILGQSTSSQPALCVLIKQHLERIAPTIGYASAQDNNHATSEAAALFIGGSWLVANGDSAAQNYADIGQRKLEEFVARLVSEDGSFSQHSLNYHRFFLDTVSMCERWRRAMTLNPFSDTYMARNAAAAEWLRHFIFADDGDGPNLGANDGARLLPLGGTYRDFRPSCQLATALFANMRAFPDEICDQGLIWLGLCPPLEILPSAGSRVFPSEGYAILRRAHVAAMLRFPRFRFRPSHCDAMHLDLWVNGKALLRDGGTYSYNEGDFWLDYFGGDAGHNSIEFDQVPQMPRVGRFLFGDWLNSRIVEPLVDQGSAICFEAAYTNRRGQSHSRHLALHNERLVVTDHVTGFSKQALMRWRLAPGCWEIQGNRIQGADMTIDINVGELLAEISLHDGFESTHYMQKTALPVLHVSISSPGLITTTFRWNI